jgi:branched-chain amino acid transport system substrate-binding protein
MKVAINRKRSIATGALVLSALLLTSACGGGSSKKSTSANSDGSLPSEVKILSTTDLTGPAAFAGIAQVKGAQLAVQEINSQAFLGGSTKIDLVSKDTAGNTQTAAAEVTEGIADASTVAILGTVSSAQSIAVAPLAQNAKIPIVFTQSGSDGTILGDYTFRVTPPQPSYYSKVLEYLKAKNVKKVAVIYNTTTPTLQELGEKTIPDNAKKYGYTVTSSSSVIASTTDFSAVISKALSDKPDVVAMLLVGAQNPTAVNQLRQAGYSGQVLANQGAGAGNLKPAGANANGVIWPTDFTFLQTEASSVKFTAAYKAKYSENPINYAAEGYDAMWMIARAIKAQGAADRSGIQKGLDKVAKDGFDGAMGKLTFVNRDLRVDATIVGWDGTNQTEVLVK